MLLKMSSSVANRHKTSVVQWAILTLMNVSFMLSAQDNLDANAIIERANFVAYYSGDDGSAEARMLIVDGQGNKQMRQFHLLRKDIADLGDQQMLVYFSKPTDVSGTVFLVHKKITTEDDRWLYLPALDLVKRISAGDKRTSFVGSHFFYEDVSGRNPKEDTYTLLDESSQGDAYVIRGEPKNAASVEFAYLIAHIDKKTFLPKQVTYFDRKGNKLREMEVLKTQIISGFTTVMHSRITQFSDNSYTEMQFRNVSYNVGLSDDIFTERSLRYPPKAWLK